MENSLGKLDNINFREVGGLVQVGNCDDNYKFDFNYLCLIPLRQIKWVMDGDSSYYDVIKIILKVIYLLTKFTFEGRIIFILQ